MPRAVRVRSFWILALCTEDHDRAAEHLRSALVICEEMINIENTEAVQRYKSSTLDLLEDVTPTSDT